VEQPLDGRKTKVDLVRPSGVALDTHESVYSLVRSCHLRAKLKLRESLSDEIERLGLELLELDEKFCDRIVAAMLARLLQSSEGDMLRKISALLCVTCALATSTAAFSQTIRIDSGTYGANCGARQGNVTRDLAAHCDSLETCRYVIDATAIDAHRDGCPADLVADWSCGPNLFHTAAVRGDTNNGSSIVLTCVPSTGAGK
jgi:hypothetical protein